MTNTSGIHLQDSGTALILFNRVCVCVCVTDRSFNIHLFHNYSDICWIQLTLALLSAVRLMGFLSVWGPADCFIMHHIFRNASCFHSEMCFSYCYLHVSPPLCRKWKTAAHKVDLYYLMQSIFVKHVCRGSLNNWSSFLPIDQYVYILL